MRRVDFRTWRVILLEYTGGSGIFADSEDLQVASEAKYSNLFIAAEGCIPGCWLFYHQLSAQRISGQLRLAAPSRRKLEGLYQVSRNAHKD